MPKAYWIAHVTVDDAAGYEAYRAANAAAFAQYGARFLARGGAQTICEGNVRPRTVVIEFADLATAQACYDSPGYAAARALRAPVSAADVVIVEGWEG